MKQGGQSWAPPRAWHLQPLDSDSRHPSAGLPLLGASPWGLGAGLRVLSGAASAWAPAGSVPLPPRLVGQF